MGDRGEACALAMARCTIGDGGGAAEMQHLRDEDSSYWTGYVHPDDVRWPPGEQPGPPGRCWSAHGMLAGARQPNAVFGDAPLPACRRCPRARAAPSGACNAEGCAQPNVVDPERRPG